MYATLSSRSSDWADSTVFEPGLRSNGTLPVLCCPAVAVVVTKVAAAGIAAATASATASADNDCTVDCGNHSVADSYACGGYVAPGRFISVGASVADDASIEELLSATAALRG